ncbi:hypothetical protein GCM10023320_82490 [Pseudonocardia adelaidensis]|uniref:Secreted protein n=1 Tax=Pseudonocardia adelaidensis TaxID=648754 RepID=A0ABP9P8W8_9PSEU
MRFPAVRRLCGGGCLAAVVWLRVCVTAVHFDVVRFRLTGTRDRRPAEPVRSGRAGGQSGGSAPGGLRRSAISFSKSSIEENDR